MLSAGGVALGSAGSAAISGSGGSSVAGFGASAGSGPAAISGSGGSGGMGAPAQPVAGAKATMCSTAPADAPAEAVAAYNATNMWRLAVGSGCMTLVPALDKSAQSHCDYNASNMSDAMCVADAHGEVMSCMGFTGVDVQAREKAAGYNSAMGVTEVLTTGGTPEQAVKGWIDTLWHRIPMLDPWTSEMGWGNASGCDVIDFGRGSNVSPNSTVVVYPYDGQTGVPVSFDGRYESPMPPMPDSGWPSSAMINIYALAIKVTDHLLTKDGDPTPLDHKWIDETSTEIDAGYRGYLYNTAFLYGNKPFAANTKYRVKVSGTHSGGAIDLEWTFTTGARESVRHSVIEQMARQR
jgi:uncharacterized protein YkwD